MFFGLNRYSQGLRENSLPLPSPCLKKKNQPEGSEEKHPRKIICRRTQMKILVNCLPSSIQCPKKWTLLKTNKQSKTETDYVKNRVGLNSQEMQDNPNCGVLCQVANAYVGTLYHLLQCFVQI